jgi:TRAP-type C4-dicarboxylate transport system substrate-binding protein
MRRRNMPVALAAALAGTSFSRWSQAASPTEWSVATGYRGDGYHAATLVWLGQAIAEATQGALRWTVVPEGKLVPLAKIPEAVAAGQPPAGECIMTSMAERWPACGADALPFVTRQTADVRRLWKAQRPVVERALKPSGLLPLYAVPWPGQGLYSVAPVRTASDFRGRRMRTYNTTTRRIAEMLGAMPVELAMADVGKAIESGRIDSMITSSVTGVDQQVWKWMPHFYDLNAWSPKNLVMVNAAAFEALDPAIRRQVVELSAEAETRGWTAADNAALSSKETLARQGMRVELTPPDLRNILVRMGERFAREWVRDVGTQANQIFIPYFTQQ